MALNQSNEAIFGLGELTFIKNNPMPIEGEQGGVTVCRVIVPFLLAHECLIGGDNNIIAAQ